MRLSTTSPSVDRGDGSWVERSSARAGARYPGVVVASRWSNNRVLPEPLGPDEDDVAELVTAGDGRGEVVDDCLPFIAYLSPCRCAGDKGV